MKIEIRKLVLHFDGVPKPLLSIEERDVASGAGVVIRGSSGSGKTSLLHAITGLLTPRSGDVRLGDISIGQLSESRRCRLRREKIGVVFQRLNLLEHLTAIENVQLGGRGVSATSAKEALASLGLEGAMHRPGYQLSLGEQQRVAVARVLAAKPDLILADEPTSALDDGNAERVMNALQAEQKRGATLLVATHDARIVDRFELSWKVAEGGIH